MRTARLHMLIGAVMFVIGVVLTVLSKHVLFWGAIVFGLIGAAKSAVRLLRLAALPFGTAVAAPPARWKWRR
jgi:hypothetical protein